MSEKLQLIEDLRRALYQAADNPGWKYNGKTKYEVLKEAIENIADELVRESLTIDAHTTQAEMSYIAAREDAALCHD